jgi:hypothetical protein
MMGLASDIDNLFSGNPGSCNRSVDGIPMTPGPHTKRTCVGKIPLRVLFFEDDAGDIELSLLALKQSEFEVTADVVATPLQPGLHAAQSNARLKNRRARGRLDGYG